MPRLSDRRAWQQLRPYHGGGGSTLTLVAEWIAQDSDITTDLGDSRIDEWLSTTDESVEQATYADAPVYKDNSGKQVAIEADGEHLEGVALPSTVAVSTGFMLFFRGHMVVPGAGTRHILALDTGTPDDTNPHVMIGFDGSDPAAWIGDGAGNYDTLSGTPTANTAYDRTWEVSYDGSTAYFYIGDELIDSGSLSYATNVTHFRVGEDA